MCTLAGHMPIVFTFACVMSFIRPYYHAVQCEWCTIIKYREIMMPQICSIFAIYTHMRICTCIYCDINLVNFYAWQHICYSACMPWQFRLSVCPSHGWISQKRLKLGSRNFHHTVAHPSSFSGVSFIEKFWWGPPSGGLKQGRGG